jgi:DNA-directed RNA polymerase specialized sigma subunit
MELSKELFAYSKRVAGRCFKWGTNEWEDAVQEGLLGSVKAEQRYYHEDSDIDKEKVPYVAYAKTYIKFAIIGFAKRMREEEINGLSRDEILNDEENPREPLSIKYDYDFETDKQLYIRMIRDFQEWIKEDAFIEKLHLEKENKNVITDLFKDRFFGESSLTDIANKNNVSVEAVRLVEGKLIYFLKGYLKSKS